VVVAARGRTEPRKKGRPEPIQEIKMCKGSYEGVQIGGEGKAARLTNRQTERVQRRQKLRKDFFQNRVKERGRKGSDFPELKHSLRIRPPRAGTVRNRKGKENGLRSSTVDPVRCPAELMSEEREGAESSRTRDSDSNAKGPSASQQKKQGKRQTKRKGGALRKGKK